MTEADRIKYLRIVLVLVGLTFTFGIWSLGIVWPSGWVWHEAGRSEYLEMILGIYATLGVFLMLAARDPMAHISLIWFTIWSSIVHGGIMSVQAIANIKHRRRGPDCRCGCIGSPDPASDLCNEISMSGITHRPAGRAKKARPVIDERCVTITKGGVLCL